MEVQEVREMSLYCLDTKDRKAEVPDPLALTEFKRKHGHRVHSSVAEHMPSMHEGLGSVSSTRNKKKMSVCI